MPSRIGQSSAPLGPLTLVGPGFLGLNTQLSSTTLGPEWAVEAKNCVFDDANRLAARFGWAAVTSSAASGTPNFKALHQYLNLSGTSEIISAGGNKIYSGTTSLTDKTGSVSITADHWKFVNFNGNTYGLQASHALVQYTGSGNFANVTAASGTVPDGNELLSAFGHLWGSTSNGQTLKYSALLDATHWTTGAGSFNFTNVWPTSDQIVALASFNNYLVVFGRNNIIIMTDGTGSPLGMNPTNTFVQDVIPGIGCVARDSVQNINGDDLVFLSATGVMSLRRVIQERSNPLRDLSKNIRNLVLASVDQETLTNVKSTFNPYYGFYILLVPTPSKIFVFDTKLNIPETGQISTASAAGAWRVTQWDSFIPTSLLTLNTGKTMYSGKSGKIFQYGTQSLDDASSYTMTYTSGWLVINDEVRDRIKFLKNLACICSTSTGVTATLRWAFDFNDMFSSIATTLTVSGGGMEWGLGEWGLGEWGIGSSLIEFTVPASGSGQFIKIGLQVPISSNLFSLSQLQLFAKVGRLT